MGLNIEALKPNNHYILEYEECGVREEDVKNLVESLKLEGIFIHIIPVCKKNSIRIIKRLK